MSAPAVLPRAAISAALAAVEARWPAARAVAVEACERHTHARAEIRYDDGRTLVVKRGEAEWRRARFAASRAACGLLRRRTGVLAPEPIDVAEPEDGLPMEAYWKIGLVPLADLWPTLGAAERARALRGWGHLLRRVHKVKPRGHGALPRAEHEPGSLEAHLVSDLGGRLLPAVRWSWPEAAGVLEALVEAAPRMAARAGSPVLLHGDPHQGNVLCELRGGAVRCAGVIDLEAAWAGPAEADVAVAELIHGPLFRPLPAGWTEEFRRGYGEALDPAAVAFYRAVHLANLGYHAALTGLHAHAAQVLQAARADVAAFRALLRAPVARGAGATYTPPRPDRHALRRPGHPCSPARSPSSRSRTTCTT